MTTKPMTKTEVRKWLKRIRDDLAWAEEALCDNDPAELLAAVMDAGGAAAQVAAVLEANEWTGDGYVPQGVRGMEA